jgi:hypothetical protein
MWKTRVTLAAGLFLAFAACSPKDPGISNANGKGGSGAPGGSGSPGTGGAGGDNGPPRTLPGTGGSGTFWPDAGTVSATADAKNCGQESFNLEKQPGEILLVLDRSGSMRMPAAAGGLTSKWMDVTGALNEVLMATDASVLWGLKMFPNGTASCTVDDGALVAPGAGNFAALSAAIGMTTPEGNGTPTAVAVRKATAYMQTRTTPNPKYLVLATDGEPNCGGGGIFGTGTADNMNAIQAVRDAAAAGFPTFVVGIAAGAAADGVLNDMATAGGQPRMAMPGYYPVSSRADFITALGAIAGQVANCVFPLTKAPPENDDVTVEINGMKIMRDTTRMQGWDYGPGKKSIQLYGAACEQLKKGTGDKVAITYGCFIP